MTELAGGLELLAGLEREGQITPVSLTIADPDFPFEQWVALGTYLGEIKKRTSWYLGDWLNFGAMVYEDRYSQAMDVTGLRYETLTNYAWVCRQVDRSRRRDLLSFGAHAEVASMHPTAQVEWLDAAQTGGWSTSELREKIREAKALSDAVVPPPPDPGPLSPRATTSAAAGLVTVRATLMEAEKAGVSSAVPALRELDRVGETLICASKIPTLREVALRLIADARPDVGDPTFSVVSTGILDELRELVATEGSTE